MSTYDHEWSRMQSFTEIEVREGKPVCEHCGETPQSCGYLDGKQHWQCACTFRLSDLCKEPGRHNNEYYDGDRCTRCGQAPGEPENPMAFRFSKRFDALIEDIEEQTVRLHTRKEDDIHFLKDGSVLVVSTDHAGNPQAYGYGTQKTFEQCYPADDLDAEDDE